jgi:hypothetical protein
MFVCAALWAIVKFIPDMPSVWAALLFSAIFVVPFSSVGIYVIRKQLRFLRRAK